MFMYLQSQPTAAQVKPKVCNYSNKSSKPTTVRKRYFDCVNKKGNNCSEQICYACAQTARCRVHNNAVKESDKAKLLCVKCNNYKPTTRWRELSTKGNLCYECAQKKSGPEEEKD